MVVNRKMIRIDVVKIERDSAMAFVGKVIGHLPLKEVTYYFRCSASRIRRKKGGGFTLKRPRIIKFSVRFPKSFRADGCQVNVRIINGKTDRPERTSWVIDCSSALGNYSGGNPVLREENCIPDHKHVMYALTNVVQE